MKKKTEYENVLNKKDSSYSFSSKLKQEDLIKLEKIKELFLEIKEKYNLTFDDLKGLVEEELSFPIVILNKKLTVLESVVKYLKEEKNLSLHKISELIGRDERNIWHTYNKAREKYSKRFVIEIKKVKFWIPISIFHDTKLSVLECITFYFHEKMGLKFSDIGKLVNRDQRTIWTVYQRARKKYGKKK